MKVLAAAVRCNLPVPALSLCLVLHTAVWRFPGNAGEMLLSQAVAVFDGYRNRCRYKVDILIDYLLCLKKISSFVVFSELQVCHLSSATDYVCCQQKHPLPKKNQQPPPKKNPRTRVEKGNLCKECKDK